MTAMSGLFFLLMGIVGGYIWLVKTLFGHDVSSMEVYIVIAIILLMTMHAYFSKFRNVRDASDTDEQS